MIGIHFNMDCNDGLSYTGEKKFTDLREASKGLKKYTEKKIPLYCRSYETKSNLLMYYR